MINYGMQHINDDDIEAVVAVLKSTNLTQGQCVPDFEKALVSYTGASYGVAANSATSALHIACLAIGLGPGDLLWTSPNTFVSSANCAIFCGASVDFVDIDSETFNISIEKLKEKLEIAQRINKLPKVVIPVHYAGNPCEMEEIFNLSQVYGFKVIEDASHALGATYTQKKDLSTIKVGSCKHSDISIFSFHPVKMITSGEGGVALTNNENYASKMRLFRSHGITSDKKLMSKRGEDEIWNYQQIELGFNYRMSDIHAALGNSQLQRLDMFVRRRNNIAEAYIKAFKDLPIKYQMIDDKSNSSFHLFPVRINKGLSGKSQRDFHDMLWKIEVVANLHYIPVHRQPFYEKMGFKKGDFPNAEDFHREVISLPIFYSLTTEIQDFIINKITNFFNS